MFAMNEPKSNIWAHYNYLLEPCFPLRSPSPTLGSIINNLRPYKYLELRIIKRQAHKLQRFKPTSVKETKFKFQKDQTHKLTSFKVSSL